MLFFGPQKIETKLEKSMVDPKNKEKQKNKMIIEKNPQKKGNSKSIDTTTYTP